MVFKELRYSAGSQVAQTECGRVIAGELSPLTNLLGKYAPQLPVDYSFGIDQVAIHGLYFWRNLCQTWKHNVLEMHWLSH